MTLLHRVFTWLYYLVVAGALTLAFVVGLFFWQANETTFALTAFTILVVIGLVYGHPRFYNYRFVAPAIIALLLVIIGPLLYIVNLSFTNMSEANKLNYRRALPYLQEQTFVADDSIELKVYGYTTPDAFHLYLQDSETDQWLRPATPLLVAPSVEQRVVLENTSTVPEEEFDRKFAITNRANLDLLTLELENGTQLSKHKLRSFAEQKLRFQTLGPGDFRDLDTGDRVQANHQTGQFEVTESEDADRVGTFISPTFLKSANLANYTKLLTDKDQLSVFGMVFAWSVFSATLTVTMSYLTALLIACLLNWTAIKEREIYKFIIVGCYALPAFAVINAFFWIFNTPQAPWGGRALIPGPVFHLAQQWFGLELDWQFDPILSRIKFLIVQFWMFMPFMLILCLGVLQSIPKAVYEAAKLEGAGARQSFFKITLPMTFLPLAPVLIIAFATAFNDLSLVDQLSFGVPEIQGSVPLATHVDLLVSFANRQAFGNVYNRGVGFGFYSLASTLFTLIFVVLAFISYFYLKLVKLDHTNKEF